MKRIVLVCSAGMSTSMLVTKMLEAAKEKGMEVNIHAISEYELTNNLGEVDVLLLAPQIRFLEGKIRKLAEPKDIKVGMIEFSDYGKMQGERILAQALQLLNV